MNFCLFLRKPYTPDIFNDLSPYYNTYVVNYMINDQVGNKYKLKLKRMKCLICREIAVLTKFN